jgi:hypothetical protein
LSTLAPLELSISVENTLVRQAAGQTMIYLDTVPRREDKQCYIAAGVANYCPRPDPFMPNFFQKKHHPKNRNIYMDRKMALFEIMFWYLWAAEPIRMGGRAARQVNRASARHENSLPMSGKKYD